MVVVEDALCAFQVEVVGGIFVPRQVHQRAQIVELLAVVGALRVERVELVELLHEIFERRLVPLLHHALLQQLFALG